ncbi:carboxypeptidase regulatory-like domain-containing protein [Terriglobus tenax]|uniref:carboxypeptidase regulatory-like domain-containing protein n=1 Tax=Terriglobus tenax TaxID=1111115 RepID=UPI0021E0CD26|nr:carboxypeptidase regulatory-like domain-containing protein [Terriglobus tenax]
MRLKQTLSLALIAASLAGCKSQPATPVTTTETQTPPVYYHVDAATAGSISGTLKYTGKRPAPRLIDISQDPLCVRSHKGKAYDESLVVDSKGDLANAFLYIKKGLEGKVFEVPATPVALDQSGCWFRPHVLGIMVGQQLTITNSDPVTHNIHPVAQINREWNHSMGPGDEPLKRKFTKPEIMVPVKCNIHDWMHSFIGVVDNPYFAVSKDDGTFRIENLPPGTYTLGVWHEKLGVQEQTITVSAKGDTPVNFTFKGE